MNISTKKAKNSFGRCIYRFPKINKKPNRHTFVRISIHKYFQIQNRAERVSHTKDENNWDLMRTKRKQSADAIKRRSLSFVYTRYYLCSATLATLSFDLQLHMNIVTKRMHWLNRDGQFEKDQTQQKFMKLKNQ